MKWSVVSYDSYVCHCVCDSMSLMAITDLIRLQCLAQHMTVTPSPPPLPPLQAWTITCSPHPGLCLPASRPNLGRPCPCRSTVSPTAHCRSPHLHPCPCQRDATHGCQDRRTVPTSAPSSRAPCGCGGSLPGVTFHPLFPGQCTVQVLATRCISSALCPMPIDRAVTVALFVPTLIFFIFIVIPIYGRSIFILAVV